MFRTTGNPAQEKALSKLLSEIGSVRRFVDVRSKYKTVITPTEMLVRVELTDFPIIEIGGHGGFEMPDIHKHPGASPPENMKSPLDGRTAFDACLFGDHQIKKQGSGAANNSPLNSLPRESP